MRIIPFLILSVLAAAWAAEPAKKAAAVPAPKADDANANGTDPTTPINRLQATLGLTDLPHEGESATLTGRVDYVVPGDHGVAVRADIPLTYLDYGPDDESGLGDAYVEVLKTLPVPDKRVTAAAALGILLPTASDDVLGYDKWILAPKVVGALHLNDKSLAYLQVQDFFSVSGNDDRSDVHYLMLTAAFRQNLDKGLWLLGGIEDRYDWKKQDYWTHGDFQNNIAVKLEGGLLFQADKAAWVDLYIPVSDNRYLDIGIAGTVMLRF